MLEIYIEKTKHNYKILWAEKNNYVAPNFLNYFKIL